MARPLSNSATSATAFSKPFSPSNSCSFSSNCWSSLAFLPAPLVGNAASAMPATSRSRRLLCSMPCLLARAACGRSRAVPSPLCSFSEVMRWLIHSSVPRWLRFSAAPVSIREFDLPTPDARPHDPAVAPDGSLWFTEQKANKLGRLDPKSGRIREYPLPTADSGPHGLIADREGNIWFTANYKGYVGKLDPKNGKVAEFPVSLAHADPHTPAIDSRGRLWFTMQQANAVGRLDPRSGKMELRKVP